MTDKNTSWKIDEITNSLNSLLKHKNEKYGDAALNPIGIFNKGGAENSLLARIDDKLGRVKNAEVLTINDTADLLGYLVLLCASKEWISFEQLKD